MKTWLIIPDIHNKYELAEKIISLENPDKVIFLGDYFDDFYDTVNDASDVASWLKESMSKPDRIHLLGNHDLSYATRNPMLKCGGHTWEKHDRIESYSINWNKLRLFYYVTADKKWLLTHAGISSRFLTQISQNLDTCLEKLKLDTNNADAPLFQVGKCRKGRYNVGGPLWCDYRYDYSDIAGINQIFGHTEQQSFKYGKNEALNSEHYCIDTKLSHYIVITDIPRVKSVFN